MNTLPLPWRAWGETGQPRAPAPGAMGLRPASSHCHVRPLSSALSCRLAPGVPQPQPGGSPGGDEGEKDQLSHPESSIPSAWS